MNFFQKWWAYLIAGAIAFFMPILSLLIATGILICADMVTGMFAAYHRKEKICSKKMGATVTKTILYFIAIILAHVMERLFWEGSKISTVVAGIFALIEFKSNLENISVVTGINLPELLKTYIEAKRGLTNSTTNQDAVSIMQQNITPTPDDEKDEVPK